MGKNRLLLSSNPKSPLGLHMKNIVEPSEMKTELGVRPSRWIVCLLLSIFFSSGVYAQDKFGERPLGSGLGDLNLLEDDSPVYELAGEFTLVQGSREGTLSITMDLKDGWHVYPQQKVDGQLPTEIIVATNKSFEVLGPFTPDRQPKSGTNELGQPKLDFEKQVIWSAPIRLADEADPQEVEIAVQLKGQVCSTSCLELAGDDAKVVARFASYTQPPTDYQGTYGTIAGQLNRTTVQPGESMTLKLSAKMVPDWHIYGYERFKQEGTTPQPTIILFTKTCGFEISHPEPSSEPIRGETGLASEGPYYYHEEEVDWKIGITVPEEIESGRYQLQGKMLFMFCTDASCDRPIGLDFTVPINVGVDTDETVQQVAFTENDTDRDQVDAMSKKFWANVDRNSEATAAAIPPIKLLSYLGIAFLAGLILNAMPCVLPVIGLKVMSFVQQAGENRGRILLLNVIFSLGLLTVFWILATLAAFFGFGWGDWLTKSMTGSIIITSVVFAFGLSMLGVWELPIPGLSGSSSVSKKSEEEGLSGAFFLGILTTVLATPCTGPLLIPAVTVTAGQPPWVAYLIFTTIGLGMAMPYLLVGLFPSLVGWLPRPGAWMNTFKQITGFILMATVVFLMSSFAGEPRSEYLVSMLTLLLAIAFGCWWIGRTSLAAEASDQLRAWAVAGVLIALGGWLGFTWFGPPKYELEWQQFSQATLDNLTEQEKLVFIDFTGPG